MSKEPGRRSDRNGKTFTAHVEDRPGAGWLARFRDGRDEAARWYLGRAPERPTAAECRAALARHMPEFVAPYDDLCAMVGDDDLAHRILSHYRPAPHRQGCSQAVWLGADGPALIRNYDYPLTVITGRIEMTAWAGRRVIGMVQRPWGGCLDGMNEDGLVASCTLGGLARRGEGFAIIQMLRYVLETCGSVREGWPRSAASRRCSSTTSRSSTGRATTPRSSSAPGASLR